MTPAAIKIKIKVKALGLSDDRYRALLYAAGGVYSSKSLTPAAEREVLRRLELMARARSSQARYIWVLWGELQPFLASRERNGAYLCGFIRKSAGVLIADLSGLDALSPGDRHTVIEALKLRVDRERGKLSSVPF